MLHRSKSQWIKVMYLHIRAQQIGVKITSLQVSFLGAHWGPYENPCWCRHQQGALGACGPQGQVGLVAPAPQAGLPCFPYLGDNTQELGLRGPELENKDHAAEIISFFIYQGRDRSNQGSCKQTNKKQSPCVTNYPPLQWSHSSDWALCHRNVKWFTHHKYLECSKLIEYKSHGWSGRYSLRSRLWHKL